MLYVFLAFYGLLAGSVSGWLMYNASAGQKKDRMRSAILWGIGVGFICMFCATGG
jgi:hypothetical protein